MENFQQSYVSYWKERVGNTVDGSRVADLAIADFYFSQLGIQPGQQVLDLGCSFGRLYDVFSKYTDQVTGVDVSQACLDAASEKGYTQLVLGKAEDVPLESNTFDHVVSWAVYDVVEQTEGLIEANRLLKNGGSLMITGKHCYYLADDTIAFIAERNAKLKNFPNHFTYVDRLIQKSSVFGLEVTAAYGFLRRGDVGENRGVDILKSKTEAYYEFILVFRKTGPCLPLAPNTIIDDPFSEVAKKAADKQGFDDVIEYFRWHKDTHEDS